MTHVHQRPLTSEVSVNGNVIHARDIAAETQNHAAPRGKPGLAWRAAARALVVRQLLLDEATRQGLSPDPQDTGGGRYETDDEALIRALIEQDINPEEITDKECRAYFDAPQTTFNAPNIYQPQHILVAAKPDDLPARKLARVKAETLFEMLGNQPDKLAALASKESDCPSKSDGGLLGQIGPGDMVPEFEDALIPLAAGQFHPGVLETQYGFHIVFMRNRADGAALPYSAVTADIREQLEKRAWVRASKAYISGLMNAAQVVGLTAV